MEKRRYDLDDEPSYNVQKQATPQDANSHRIPIIIHAYHCRDVNCHLKEKLELDYDDWSSSGVHKKVDPQETEKNSIHQCIQTIEHVYQCRDKNCHLVSCQRMKNIIEHVKQCKLKSNKNCPFCKQYIAFCIHHAKYCTDAKCPVLFCLNIKKKIKQQDLQQSRIETQYCCTNYDDVDSRIHSCKKGKQLNMEKLSFDLDEKLSSGVQKQVNPKEDRKLSIHRCVQTIEHAYLCKDTNCNLVNCQRMKNIIEHVKQCKLKSNNGNCPFCKQYIAFCIHHAKYCNDAKCPVLFCLNVKKKIKQQGLQQSHMETQYCCTNYDSCVHSCKKIKPNNIEKPGFDLDNESSSSNPQEAEKLSIQQECMEMLIHVCQCWNFNCNLAGCQQMKKVLQHVKLCKVKSNGNCSFCKQYIDLCTYHAKRCTNVKCSVFLCSNIKRKIKQQFLQQKLQQKHVETRYYSDCNDFDSCTYSYKKEKPQNMEKLGLGLEDGLYSDNQKKMNSQKAQKLFIRQRTTLLHASQCRDLNCCLESCRHVKRLINHVKLCKVKPKGNCSISKEYITICFHHAKYCTEVKCPVLFCLNMKHKIKQQHLQQEHMETIYYFTDCDDFDSCDYTFKKEELKENQQNMKNPVFDLDDGSSSTNQKQANQQEAKKLSFCERIITLLHASQCWDLSCRAENCGHMKRVLKHVKLCKVKPKGNCSIYKEYITTCFHHAKYCTEIKCPVLFCLNIKHKIKQQNLQQETIYHCTECNDFDSCIHSYGKENPQNMEKSSLNLDDEPSSDNQNQVDSQEAKKLSTLLHTCQCWDLNCHLESCCHMKRVVKHVKLCKVKPKDNCTIYKEYITLCFHHAENCTEIKCPVFLCSDMKHKIKQQPLKQRLEQVQLLKRNLITNTDSREMDNGAPVLNTSYNMINQQNMTPLKVSGEISRKQMAFVNNLQKEEITYQHNIVNHAASARKVDTIIIDEQMIPKPNITDIKPYVPTISDNNISIQSCVFKPDELRLVLMPTLEKLYKQEPEVNHFKQPYKFNTFIIKKPIDLSTIRENLNTGQYSDPWDYVDDVWLMFENGWKYNKKSTIVYKSCTKLSEVFEQEIYHVMKSLGFCCGRKYTFTPQNMLCSKLLCIIPRDASYFSFEHQYNYCLKCFKDISDDVIILDENLAQKGQKVIKKEQFVAMKNDHQESEPFVICTHCRRKLHQICVLFNENISSQGYVCDNCMKNLDKKQKYNKFSAKNLSKNKLDMFIETRVNNFLKKNEAGAGEVTIRVVSCSDKIVKVKPKMRSYFVDNGDMAGEFPYVAKSIYAFEEIDGTDVCFFGMHVQEYGSEAPPPNTRRVYIAYLDSVKLFRPKEYRTFVYHEILLGYLDFVKRLGYTMAHVWVCPPSKGDNYIFHCHPPNQKIPKSTQLLEWYKKMLNKGVNERIVLDYKDILTQAVEDKLTSAAELPYFEGDFWPNVFEEIIKQFEQEKEKKRKLADAEESVEMCVDEIGPSGKKNGIQNSKRLNILLQTNIDLSAKIISNMELHREVFFVIRLHSTQFAATFEEIQDPDPLIKCDLMDDRNAFLTVARENYYEFSSLRRAKFSSMAILYKLHNKDKFFYMCKKCRYYHL